MIEFVVTSERKPDHNATPSPKIRLTFKSAPQKIKGSGRLEVSQVIGQLCPGNACPRLLRIVLEVAIFIYPESRHTIRGHLIKYSYVMVNPRDILFEELRNFVGFTKTK